MLRYAYRALAIAYLLVNLMWVTSRIGIVSSTEPITWWAAWLYVVNLAAAMLFGWNARGECEQEKP